MTIRQISTGDPDGTSFSQGITDKVSFYGVTPVAQRTAAIQALSYISVSSNATIGSADAAWKAEVTATLIGLGFWKGA